MAVLEQYYPLLVDELNKTEEDISAKDLKIEAAATGDPTLIFRGIYIHSKRDPRREAHRLVESAAADTVQTSNSNEADYDRKAPALALGFGLGYTAQALAEKYPKKPIIVVEKHPLLIKLALETRDFRELLSQNRLIFVLGGEGVGGALSLFENGDYPLLVQNRALAGMDKEWYALVEEKVKNWNTRTNVNRATQKRFGKRWVKNLSQNLTAIRDIPGISGLEGIFRERNIPVFLAAAGPTLDAIGPALGEISKRCVTVAVDTSLRFLLSWGVDPDFVVSVDPQFWNYHHLYRAPAPKTCLIAESAVYPPVLRQSFGGIFLSGSFFPLGRFIEEKVDSKGELGTGGSVATSAWDFIRVLGGRQLWIAGLDLSFPELKTHFKGALFEEKSHTESCRFSPVETKNFHALRDGFPFRAPRQSGGTVLTDKRLSLYAAWFENRFSRYGDIQNYCLSGEGLSIPGQKVRPIEELLSLPERRTEIDQILKNVFFTVENDFYSEEAKQKRADLYKNAKKSLLNGLGEIKILAINAAKSADKAVSHAIKGRLDKKEEERTLNMLDEINKSISRSEVKEIAGFLFPEITDWETEIAADVSATAKTNSPLIRHLAYSARFYKALAEAADYNLEKL